MINLVKKHKYFICLVFIAIAAILITYSRNIALIIDCGREVYYPQEILNGKVLYRDLFNIYAPFAYLFNAILYKIFGINIEVLKISGAFCATGIVCGIFLLAKSFFNEKFAFYIGFFSVVVGILPIHIFNYVFPYAFAITYGLLAFIFSLLFLIYYVKSNSKKFLYLSLLLAGLAVSCKYEFLMYVFIYPVVFFKMKTDLKSILTGFLCFIAVPFVCFSVLFVQGLRFSDLTKTAAIISAMSKTQTLKYFYMHCGVFPHKKTAIAFILNFCYLFAPLYIYLIPILNKEKIKNPASGLFFTYGALCLMFLFYGNKPDLFMPIALILLLAVILRYKNVFANFAGVVFVISVLLVSVKSFCGVITFSYGNYYLPLLLLGIATVFKDRFNEKEWDYIGFYVLLAAVLIGFNSGNALNDKNTLISTPKGQLYVEKKYDTTNQLLKYIKENTKKNDKIIIYPEGMMINFLSDRKTDDFLNSFLPLYEETFGTMTYVEYFKQTKPEYIIFNSWNSSDYYFSIICKDYGFAFCDFVKKNYNEKMKLSGGFSYTVYKKK